MIVVGGVEDYLRREPRITALDHPNHIFGSFLLHLVAKRRRDHHPEWNGTEFAAFRRLNQPIEILAAEGCDALAGVLGCPSLHLKAGTTLMGKAEQLAGPRSLNDLPRVTSGRRGVDDDRPGGARPGGALVFVIPAPVPKAGGAG